MIIQPLIGGQTTKPTAQSTGSSSGRVIQPLIGSQQPILQRQPTTQPTQPSTISKPMTLFKQVSDIVTNKLNQIIPGGLQAGIQRVKATPLKEFFLPTATRAQPVRQYVADTAKTAVNTIKGVGKLTPPYMFYRAITGNPITPKEYAKTVLESGLGVLNVAWRVNPAAPIVGAGFNSWKGVREYFQGKIDAGELVERPIQGINTQPGLGEVFTDNVKLAEAIDIVFLATMFVTPFAKKKIGELNLKAEEFNKAIKPLGLKPTDSMSKVEKVIRAEFKKIPDAFTSNPTPESVARRTVLTDALNAFKKVGVLDKKWATAYDFITGKLGIETKPFVPTPKQISATIPEGSTTVYRTAPTLEPGTQVFTTKEGAEVFATPQQPVREFVVNKSEITPSVLETKAKAGIMDFKGTEVVQPQEVVQPSIPEVGGVGGEGGEGGVKPIEVKTPSKIAKSIEAKAIEQKLTEGFEGIAGYDKITIKKQAELASNLMRDLEKASKVIRGEEPLPEGLRGTALITAAEGYIKETGDAKLAYELANSPLVSETSAAAQEMRLAAEREQDSLTKKFQELKKVREEAIEKRTGKKVKEVIKDEVAKIKKEIKPPLKDSWVEFLKSIECQY